ncbi:MAG: sortase [Candidatus Pacebacteria bacterium]|nr:sortase [Candidatus Paceibacterota bacterium]
MKIIWENRFAFLGTFFLVFTVSYVILVAVDFLPEAPAEEVNSENVENSNSDQMLEVSEKMAPSDESEVLNIDSTERTLPIAVSEEVVMPLTITIEKLDKTITVINPTSRTIADLDTALLDGVVRHPDSATLGRDGNVFILGHSSYLPTVFNKNFQAFNGIQKLEWGDIIEVSSADAVYQYRVEKVYKAIAQDLTVPIAGTEKILTLATCNSFGSVDDRYIVEAKQISVNSI